MPIRRWRRGGFANAGECFEAGVAAGFGGVLLNRPVGCASDEPPQDGGDDDGDDYGQGDLG